MPYWEKPWYEKHKENLNSWEFKLISVVANRIIAELKQLALFLNTSKHKYITDMKKEEEIIGNNQVMSYIKTIINIYSETCLSWPPTVPETVVNISKWSTYTNVSQNNFKPYRILFPT